MKSIASLICLTLVGCAPVIDAQQGLVNQALRGIDLADQSFRERAALIDAYHQLQRKRLDDAFDADVRDREFIEPDWVLEHRRAYSSAVETLTQVRLDQARRDEVDAANLASARHALERLSELFNTQLQLSQLPGETKP